MPIALRTLSLLVLATASPLAAADRDVRDVYQELCANCHGKELDGGQVPSLLDHEWVHGGSDTEIARSIRLGYPESGMPAWGDALTEAEIRGMIVYIQEMGTRAREKSTVYPQPDEDTITETQLEKYRLEAVADDLDGPWSIAFLPDGRILFTEVSGKLRVISKEGKLERKAIKGTPKVRHIGQGGLLAVAPHPEFATNGWIYLSYSDTGPDDEKGNSTGMTAVVRGRIRSGKWVDEEIIFKADPKSYRPGGVHFGSRFVFDGQGYLFFSIGERGTGPHAQDLSRPNGKIHRLWDDGRIPADNPFVNEPGAMPSIWSYGHRNPQGLDLNPVTGEIWETEHGPRGGDELNVIEKGKNYGWNVITFGMNYNGTPITEETTRPGMEPPLHHWTPSIAVCGIDFYEGAMFPNWQGDLLVTSLAQEELRRLTIRGHEVVNEETLFRNIGRVRDVAVAPDGSIYIALNRPDRIVRLVAVP